MSNIIAGIVMKNEFTEASAKSKSGKKIDFSGYVSYVSRKEATLEQNRQNEVFSKIKDGEYVDSYEEFHNYVDGYMNDTFKTKGSGLFNQGYDSLSLEQYQELKNQFKKGQQNGAPLWQDVISFDNRWLEKHGIYSKETNSLNEDLLRNAIRSGVTAMMKKEGLFESTVWYGAIHYNTDNIHVHVASVEPTPSPSRWNEKFKRYRGKRNKKSTEQLKSKVANYILDRGEEQKKINDLIRNKMIEGKKDKSLIAFSKTKNLFLEAMAKLPDDKKQWFYNYNSIDEARPIIDEITTVYLENFHKEEIKELNFLLNEEMTVLKETYGEGSKYDNYKNNKKKDLYTRMGNAILQEMRQYDTQLKKETFKKNKGNSIKKNMGYQNRFYENFRKQSELHKAIRQLHFSLKKSFHEHQKDKNIAEFDRMLEYNE